MVEATKSDGRHYVTSYVTSDVNGRRALRPVLLLYAIARNGDNRLRLLHVPLGFRQEALVVFSSWRAAQNFFLSEVFRGEWYTRECSGGELISLLLGPYEGIEWVLFDPLPEGGEHLSARTTQANLLSRESFVDYLSD
jgi:hypothetical protein